MAPRQRPGRSAGIQVVARLHYLYQWERNSLMRRVKTCMVLLTLAAISCGCPGGRVVTGHTVVSQRPVAKDATREELLEVYNLIARGTKTLNATVEMKPTAGSQYSGVKIGRASCRERVEI